MKRKKLNKKIRAAVLRLSELHGEGVTITWHCVNDCWRVKNEGEFVTFAVVRDGEVVL